MRILQLVTRRQHRGAEVFATQLSDALAARGHEVYVVGLFPPPDRPLDPLLAEVEDVTRGANGRFDVRRLRGVSEVIRRIRPDVVQANGSQTLKYGTISKRIGAPRYPLIYRNISMASGWVRSPAHRAWGRWLVGALDHVSSVSEESSRDFGVTYGVKADRRSVIRRGILVPEMLEPDRWRAALLETTGAPDDARIIAHVGSFSEEKNHAWLVDAFPAIRREVPNTHLVLIGDGPLRDAVERQIAEADLGETVHLLGLRPDAANLVGGADLFVLPSRIEGIPGVVLEAGARAIPTVATRVGGIAEAVADRKTGVLVNPNDRDAFVRNCVALLSDSSLRLRMGEEARTLVRERFSMDSTVSAFEDLYTRLIGDRHG